MFNFVSKFADADFKVHTEKRITQNNIDPEALVYAGDIAAAQLVRAFDPTLKIVYKQMPTSLQSELSALTKGVRDILSGVNFTATIGNIGYVEGRVLTSLAIQSSTRKDIIYQPTAYECQCEGHIHHGVCKHRLVRKVLDVYVELIQAREELQARYARLGVELKVVTRAPQTMPNSIETYDDLMAAFAADAGMDLREHRGH